MDFIGDDTYDLILKLKLAKNEATQKEYNYILELLNSIAGLKGDFKYKSLLDFNKVSENIFEKEETKKIFYDNKGKIKKILKIEINKDNKITSELRKIVNSEGYKLKYNTKYKTYSIRK